MKRSDDLRMTPLAVRLGMEQRQREKDYENLCSGYTTLEGIPRSLKPRAMLFSDEYEITRPDGQVERWRAVPGFLGLSVDYEKVER